ncbi:hypothetical protein [Actinopolyspora halophila]|uniref:hypothetical protein n=1 Tax=Actinopolyspora halophila TaxID=1850 RepID=UPI000364B2BB|nr:hypothetical protein [Actinopolyspora halophila]
MHDRGVTRAGTGTRPPLWQLTLLAALGVPRAVAHDLELVGSGVNTLLALAPPVCWVLVVLLARIPDPLRTLTKVGACHGVLLGAVHQVLWRIAYDGDPPRLGGDLAGLPEVAHVVITRGFAFGSSVVTGVLVGVFVGLVAWGLGYVLRR